jgi:hypothetical protein
LAIDNNPIVQQAALTLTDHRSISTKTKYQPEQQDVITTPSLHIALRYDNNLLIRNESNDSKKVEKAQQQIKPLV